jgi:lysozyme family protein
MSAAFDASLPFVLRWEGGYVNHPNDPGGATNKGVTQKVYDSWRSRQGLEPRDVRAIEDAEVRAIYEQDYWLPPHCDALERQLDLVQFDTAVNMGVGRAVRLLQASINCDVDGQFGPATMAAATACDVSQTASTYCARRERFYRALADANPRMRFFLKGWLNRLNALRLEVGLPAPEARGPLDMGDAGYIARIPDIGEDPAFDIDLR